MFNCSHVTSIGLTKHIIQYCHRTKGAGNVPVIYCHSVKTKELQIKKILTLKYVLIEFSEVTDLITNVLYLVGKKS